MEEKFDGVGGLFESLLTTDLSVLTPQKLMELYNNASKIQQQRKQKQEEKNMRIRALEEKYKGIRVALGVPWVSLDIVNDFVNELLQLGGTIKNLVSYESTFGRWSVYKCMVLNSLNDYTYGTQRYSALRIIEATLNMREIIVKDGAFINEEETVAATQKQKLIIEKFNDWVWKSDDRKEKILSAYNQMFSDIKINTGENINLEFKGKNDNVLLYDYQKSAIKRIVANKNTLLAFEVGTGKTYIMIASAMEMRAKGVSKKNMFVVPNNIVSQWKDMFLTLYPNATLLIVEPKNFTSKHRKKVLEDIKNNDYDGIIIAYSCFGEIKVSQQFECSLLMQKLNKTVKAMQNIKYYNSGLSNQKDRLIKNINELKANNEATDNLCFDELEINSLYVDEAHNFKNVPLETSMGVIRGINPVGSAKCRDMLTKVRVVQFQNNGRGVIFATGTPLSNSISDAYMMQNYLQIERLEKCGLDLFDNWVKTFAQVESMLEISVDGKSFRKTRRFTKFFNLLELSKMFAEIAIFHSNQECDLPEKCEYVNHKINGSFWFKGYMDEICNRAEKVKMGIVPRSKDNMLTISTDGRKSALDLELVSKYQQYDSSSKVFNCVNNVFDIYTKFPQSSQIIFCDYSTPKGEDFSIYKKLKQKFEELGINSKEIAFVHSAGSEAAKQKMFSDVNAGRIRILIGSTCKLGIGANVQTKLKAIHHLDVPWRPADMVQREGRILRQGNLNKEVFVYRYVLEGSFDAYFWQILETKQTFISQFLSNASGEREMSDLEENVLDYAEVKALALSEPLMKNLIQKENEIKNAQIVQIKNIESKNMLKEKIRLQENEIQELKNYIKNCENMAKIIKNYDKKQIKQVLSENLESLSVGKISIEPGVELFDIFGFSVCAPVDFKQEKPVVVVAKDGCKFEIEIGLSLVGNSTRVLHFFTNFEDYTQKQKSKLELLQLNQTQCINQYQQFDISDINVKRLIAERDELKEKILQKVGRD